MLIFELNLETIVFSNFDKSYKQRLPEFDAYSYDQLKIQIHTGSVSVLVTFFGKFFKNVILGTGRKSSFYRTHKR